MGSVLQTRSDKRRPGFGAALLGLGFFSIFLLSAARADFVAYNFFGADVTGATVSNVTRFGISTRLYLPAPLYLEDFASGTETLVSSVPGWSQTNRTDHLTTGLNPNDPLSDTYLGWVLIGRTRLSNVFGGLRLQVAPGQEVNGQPVTQLLSDNLLYAESDQRGGNQYQVLFSPTYNFSGQSGVVLVFNSAYEQNQDSIAGVEYTLDGGASWLPVVYMLDDQGGAADVIRTNGVIDVWATFGTARSDQAFGMAYSNFLAAPVSEALRPYISGRINDDAVESKRVEVFRLPAADNQPNVRFRLFQAGTASWYWGIDHWGLYSVPYTDVATGTLQNQTNGASTGITLTLSAGGRPLSAVAVTPTLPPAPEAGSPANTAFAVDLSTAGASTLYASQVNFLDLAGLNPQKTYELVLYSDRGAGDRSTGYLLSYTLSGALGFVNSSTVAPPLSVISGAQNETVTIDVTDNGRIDRGYVCRFTGIRAAAGGSVRVTMTSAQGACLNALKLVETTPQPIVLSGLTGMSEHSVTVAGVQAMEGIAAVYVCYGLSNAGNSTNSWDHVVFLGNLTPGQFQATLSGLDTFKKYYVAICAVGSSGPSWSGVQFFRPQFPGMLYATGFEPDEAYPYAAGSLAGQGMPGLWSVSQGSATVQSATKAHGLQAVQAGDCTLDVSLLATQQVLWVDAFFLESGMTNAPVVPTNAASSLVYFSATDGILALNGNGSGGGGFVQVASSFPTNVFVRVSIRTDYANKRYDVWIDGVQRRAGLGFKDNTVTRFSGARRRSNATSYMDDFSVSVWGLDADSDGDGLVDLDEAKFYGSYPLLADSDGDGASDAEEVRAGTDPGDPNSIFALKVSKTTQHEVQIRVPTITGLQYTLQRRLALGSGTWEDVANATNFPGDGTLKEFLQTPDGHNYFYRGVIINR